MAEIPKIITCAVVEDEPLALQMMEKYVSQTPFLRFEGGFRSAEKILAAFDSGFAPDLLFCDIHMPKMNGMELSRHLNDKTKVIFATAYSQYAIEGYKVNAVDYLLKPISYEDFLAAAKHAAREIEKESNAPQRNVPATISIKSEYRTHVVRFEDIDRIEGMGDYVKIVFSNGSYLLSLMRLKDLYRQLPEDDFIQVHKSHIVRIAAIKSFNAKSLEVGGFSVPIGANHHSQVERVLSGR
ncbi:MAG: response regulator transcription factor [Bacteroidales bacterium]|nr:response regulator transcription factor [Candidatus Cacconaster equi]